MASLTLRLTKGSPLTNAEVDNNFSNLNNELSSHTSNINSNVGVLASLTTGAKSNVVSAINEVQANSGVLSNLTTTAKSNLVSAINEVKTGTSTAAITSGTVAGVVITNSTWNGNTITGQYGGTGITSYAVGDLLYATGSTTLGKLADVDTGNALISGGVGANPSYGKIGLTTHISGTLAATNGGTDQSSYTTGDILYASSSSALAKLADVATGNSLISGGVGVAPSWGKVGLTTHVTGTLPVANGGTGNTTFTANSVLIGNGTNPVFVVAPGTNGNVLTSDGTTWRSTAAAGGVTLSDDTSTNASYYPTIATATSGSVSTLKVTSTKFYFNPSTGTLNATVFNSLSDINYKKDVEVISNAPEVISRLSGVEFTWLDNNKRSAGLIAQELEKVIPYLVDTNEHGIKTVNYAGIIAHLVEAVKDLQERVRVLESR